jgi:hypothetical protein
VKPPPLKPGAPPIDIMAAAMDPLEAGRLVLEGVRNNDLYILTHPEFQPSVLERVSLMLASFSKEPVPEPRRVATQAITPDIYAAELMKKGLLRKKPARKAAAKKKRARSGGTAARAKVVRSKVVRGKVARAKARKAKSARRR